MTRSSVRYAPAYLTCVFLLILVFGSFQPAQSIALSSLCGQFGHSCFGGKEYIDLSTCFYFVLQTFSF